MIDSTLNLAVIRNYRSSIVKKDDPFTLRIFLLYNIKKSRVLVGVSFIIDDDDDDGGDGFDKYNTRPLRA